MNAEQERAAIVAWLRGQAVIFLREGEALVLADNDRGARLMFAGRIIVDRAADLIERGDHLPTPQPIGNK